MDVFLYFIFLDMPTTAKLFDIKAEPIYDFGVASRNTVRFNPQGRYILLIIWPNNI